MNARAMAARRVLAPADRSRLRCRGTRALARALLSLAAPGAPPRQ